LFSDSHAMSALLILASVVVTSLSGGAAIALRSRPRTGQRLASALLVGGALLGIGGALGALSGEPVTWSAGWATPGGALSIRVDALSALFLLPILGLPALGSVYGLGYWPQAERGRQSIRLQLYYGLVTGSMALVCVSANAILFLAAWEVMALAGFLLVLTEHDKPEAQRAAFVYLASAHVGNLALFALFALLGRLAGSFELAAMAGLAGGTGAASWIFALALGGFGLKAGLVPLHFWLPGAHAAAPSHVSALMSGVLLKTGIYGLLRVTGLFDAPPAAWGAILVGLGAISAVLGVGFALAQHDLKRLLAYHSVENIGIIAMGMGLALLGRTYGDAGLTLAGFAGAVLHVVNHATFKGLLFLGAGAVQHATGTRELDHLGGLSRAMPITAALFLVGATAISGLPPLNGFVSEFLVYAGALNAAMAPTGSPFQFALVAIPSLALVGGLAAACFAKVFGTVFLGQARSGHAGHAHEPPWTMLAPMGILAVACAAIGLAPAAVLPALASAAAQWARLPAELAVELTAGAARQVTRISLVAAALLLAVGVLVLWRRWRLRAAQPAAPTWGCGFARPTARMQYTGSSFADSLVLRFGWVFFPKTRVVVPTGPFPKRAAFDSSVPDTVLEVGIVPTVSQGARGAERVRAWFIGRVQFQALLVVLGLITLLGWWAAW
jgi:formate hydrogenlyase subunit 3/multisubunit Na+/H+ antiporter MnhD subunit